MHSPLEVVIFLNFLKEDYLYMFVLCTFRQCSGIFETQRQAWHDKLIYPDVHILCCCIDLISQAWDLYLAIFIHVSCCIVWAAKPIGERSCEFAVQTKVLFVRVDYVYSFWRTARKPVSGRDTNSRKNTGTTDNTRMDLRKIMLNSWLLNLPCANG